MVSTRLDSLQSVLSDSIMLSALPPISSCHSRGDTLVCIVVALGTLHCALLGIVQFTCSNQIAFLGATLLIPTLRTSRNENICKTNIFLWLSIDFCLCCGQELQLGYGSGCHSSVPQLLSLCLSYSVLTC